MKTRRIRLEIPWEVYETFRYWGLLRGQPVGMTIAGAIGSYAVEIRKEFPAVQAHVRAIAAAQEGGERPTLREVLANPPELEQTAIEDIPW